MATKKHTARIPADATIRVVRTTPELTRGRAKRLALLKRCKTVAAFLKHATRANLRFFVQRGYIKVSA